MQKTRSQFYLPCIIGIVLCLAIASFSGWVTETHIQTWFVDVAKPNFNPPAWVFGPVWTVLYILIGISGGILWVYRRTMRIALFYFLAQLVLNFAWSFIFFGAQQIGLALIDMGLMIILVLLTIIYCWRPLRLVAFLLTPYLAWLCFAFCLNYAIWVLN